MRPPAAIAALIAFLCLPCISQGKGSPQRGRQVTVVEFADFQCPFCAKQAPDLTRLRSEYGGRVSFVFKNFPLSFHKQSRAAHLAALAAGKQGKFWEMHNLIFASPHHLSPEDFDRYAAQLNLRMEEFRGALADPAQSALLNKEIAEGKAYGINATPTFLVDGHKLAGRQSYSRLKQILEAELRGEPWPAIDRIQVEIADAPTQGAEVAPVTIVEFADFQCPFCAGAVHPLNRFLQANRGKVRLVFKNFPLDSHANSRLAHMAALAAGEQGKFWEMHDLLYAHQRTLQRSDLMRFAEQLQLDAVRFDRDLDNPRLSARIDEDRSEGERIGVAATPTFIVDGEAISGFSAARLQAKIDAYVPTIDPSADLAVTEIPTENLSLGSNAAKRHIEWYVDLTSPLTSGSAVALSKFMAAHRGDVSVRFRNFPLPTHPGAMQVHEFALAAAAQGKFWQVESLLLADSRPKDRNELELIAAQAQLDEKKLWEEVDGHKYAALISRDLVEAKRHSVSGTPTFLIDGKKFDGVNGVAAVP